MQHALSEINLILAEGYKLADSERVPLGDQALCVRTLKNLRMSKRMKLGRPPLPEGASREGRLFCRLLLSEVEEIERAAKAAKKSKSDWIRETLLAAARKAPGR